MSSLYFFCFFCVFFLKYVQQQIKHHFNYNNDNNTIKNLLHAIILYYLRYVDLKISDVFV